MITVPSLPRAPQRITPAFAFSFVDRAVREGLTLRQFGRPEMNKVVRFFYTNQEPECVYCGNNEVRRWDHLVPVMKGGDTVQKTRDDWVFPKDVGVTLAYILCCSVG